MLRITRRLAACILAPQAPALGTSVVAMGYGLLPTGCYFPHLPAQRFSRVTLSSGARCSVLQCPGIISNVICIESAPAEGAGGVVIPAMYMSSAQVHFQILSRITTLNRLTNTSRCCPDTAAARLFLTARNQDSNAWLGC